MKSLHVLGICGSLRRQSTNLGLLRYAKEHAPLGMGIELADLQNVPCYNADLKEIPGPVQKLNESIGKWILASKGTVSELSVQSCTHHQTIVIAGGTRKIPLR